MIWPLQLAILIYFLVDTCLWSFKSSHKYVMYEVLWAKSLRQILGHLAFLLQNTNFKLAHRYPSKAEWWGDMLHTAHSPVEAVINGPTAVFEAAGLSHARQAYLHCKVRPFVWPACRDLLCPPPAEWMRAGQRLDCIIMPLDSHTYDEHHFDVCTDSAIVWCTGSAIVLMYW